MWVISREWVLKPEMLASDLVITLVELGEQLGQPCTVLLEGKEGKSERSYLGFGDGWSLHQEGEKVLDPVDAVRNFMNVWKEKLKFLQLTRLPDVRHKTFKTLESGLIGYIDYEWGLVWHRPASAKAKPGFFFRLCPVNIVLLPQLSSLVLEIFGEKETEVLSLYEAWSRKLSMIIEADKPPEQLQNRLHRGPTPHATLTISHPRLRERQTSRQDSLLPAGWKSNMPKEDFLTKVKEIKELINAGDIFQAVLSQRFSRKLSCSKWELYKKLRQVNPSPYLFCIEGIDVSLVGSSPELLISTIGPRVRTRPIAGTRPRGRTEQEDLAYEEELRQDIKENAEHAMLVDLGRNDIGRVARYGTVKVSQYAQVERFSHVMHLVSTVEGELDESQDGLAALKAAFPAGTLSGAPKVRAMEILQELEPERRGAYGGALGIVRWNGDVDFCITIRTLFLSNNEVSVQTGAGIVFDSVPEREYEETIHKAKALIKVVNECADSD